MKFSNDNALAPRCMGRVFISLPSVFSVSNVITASFKGHMSNENISYFDVTVYQNKFSDKEFLSHVHRRHAELSKNPGDDEDVLRYEKKMSDKAVLFRILRVENAYISELHFIRGNTLAIVKLKSYENSYVEAEARLVEFMQKVNSVNQVGNTGFCLGALSVQGDFKTESSGSYWTDKAGNTFDIHLDSIGTGDADSLLQRMRGPDSLLNLFNIRHTVLRSNHRVVAEIPAEEWLGWTNLGEKGDEKTFKFVLETKNPEGSKNRPNIRITFNSAQKLEDGTNAKTNMTDKEAMAMWDAVINSIQLAN